MLHFLPALSDNWSWKPSFGLFESGRFTQVLLYSDMACLMARLIWVFSWFFIMLVLLCDDNGASSWDVCTFRIYYAQILIYTLMLTFPAGLEFFTPEHRRHRRICAFAQAHLGLLCSRLSTSDWYYDCVTVTPLKSPVWPARNSEQFAHPFMLISLSSVPNG